MQREEEALKVVEFARAKYLANTFQNIEVSLRHPGLKQQTKEVQSMLYKTKLLEAEYTARLANSERSSDTKELNALRVQINEAKKTLRTDSWKIINTHSNYETLVLTSPINVATLRRYVPPGALAIEFLPTDEQLYIFALTRSQLLVRSSMVSRDSLMKLMLEYRKLLQDPSVFSGEASDESVISMTRFAVLSTQLYDFLLRPVDDLFDRSLIIAESQEIDGFPFHAIERQDRKGNITYVIEMTSVDYMPSLASLRYHSTATSHIQEVVAFGNPTGKNWSVDYELRDIRSFFKGATVMVGLETSWDNLKSVNADILQISTEFSRQQSTTVPFEKLSELEAIPVIILSNYYGQGEGLSAEHALLLRLNGTSDIFLNAWLADRKAAKFFSEYFFTHLANGLAPGDAYRQALLNLIRIREVSHPRSWGQFFHFGIG
jgi:hypothetical protein